MGREEGREEGRELGRDEIRGGEVECGCVPGAFDEVLNCGGEVEYDGIPGVFDEVLIAEIGFDWE